jgi:hypothetical protein
MAKAKGVYSPKEIEAFDQKIEASAERLSRTGKTPEDAVAFFRANLRGRVRPGWTAVQYWHALELGCLVAQRQILGGSGSPSIAVTLGQWLATAGENLVRHEPAYLVGQKVADGRAQKSLEREIEAEECREAHRKLPPTLSDHRKHQLIAEKIFGDQRKYKTVERRLRHK